MHRILTFAVAASLAAAAWAHGAMPAQAADAPAPVAAAGSGANEIVTPEVTRLKNGLRVLTLTDAHALVSSFQVWYDTGSRNEQVGATGMSEMLEALMFRGTKSVSGAEFSGRLGAVGALNDARTTYDVSSYWEALLPDQLDLAARLEADRMANLVLTPSSLDSARTAVLTKRQQAVEGSPIAAGLELLSTLAYDSNPYRWPSTGWPQDVDAITLDEMKQWYAQRSTPDKAIVVIAGPTTHEANVRLVERWFGALKPGQPAPRVGTDERPQDGERRGTLSMDTSFPLLLVGYKTPPDTSADAPVFDVMARILSGGASGRLTQALVKGNQSALFAAATHTGRKDVGLFYVAAGLRAGRERDSLEAGITRAIDALAADPAGDDELLRAQNQLATQYWFGLDRVQDRASAVAEATLTDGDPGALARRVGRWQAVTGADVLRVARQYLRPQNRTVVWVQSSSRSGS